MLGFESSAAQSTASIGILAISSYLLSARYYASAAFERPLHFSFLTLIFASIALKCLSIWRSRQRHTTPIGVLKEPTSTYHLISSQSSNRHLDCARRLVSLTLTTALRVRRSFILIGVCATVRPLLFWVAIRNSQCARLGTEAFLPCMVLILDHFIGLSRPPTAAQLGSPAKGGLPSKQPVLVTALYGLGAFLWAITSIAALDRTITPTGTVCPIGPFLERYVPMLQLGMCALDATLIAVVARLRTEEADSEQLDIASFISHTLFISAIALVVVCRQFLAERLGYFMPLDLHSIDVYHLVLDSILASSIILSGIHLLATLHPTTVTLLGSSLLLFGFQIPNLNPSFLVPPLVAGDVFKATSLVVVLLAPLLFAALPPRPATAVPATTTSLHRRIVIGYGAVAAFSLLLSILFPIPAITTTTADALHSLIASGQKHADEWAAQAASSKNLDDAVAEYKRRYKLSPPPNFDKWYAYATEHNSAIIDDFDQIHNDLLPFWGQEPSVIREKTGFLMEYDKLGMGGLRFRNGSLDQSPSIPGSHRWMTDTFNDMIQPFAQWLPDMDLVMNLGDECHITVPFEKMQGFLASAEAAIQRAASTSNTKSHFTLDASLWPGGFPESIPEDVVPTGWRDYKRVNIFDNHVASSCAPGTKSRRTRWWDWSASCGHCVAPHSAATRDGLLVANTTLALDLCHQPDMAYLNGFVTSPGTMVGSNDLFPVFSQSRFSGFADILFPSPWDFTDRSEYKEDADPEWDAKSNSLYWRGSSSDGLASYGVWPGFLRARFVHEAYEHTNQLLAEASSPTALSAASSSPFRVNVSFAGNVEKCDSRDCSTESSTFQHWGLAVLPASEPKDETKMPPSQPYEENFQHRHLIDMDGAGFSGRFIPFLESRSLVYRAAVFHTWVDERVQAWQHYVPVDARLGSGFWALIDYLAGAPRAAAGTDDAAKAAADGEKMAKRIADEGRDWAKKTLRKEDMQIYIFRLLLEWARVVDDDRETIGFVAQL